MTYLFHCKVCNEDIVLELPIEKRNTDIYCSECRTLLKKKITIPNLVGFHLGSSNLKKD